MKLQGYRIIQIHGVGLVTVLDHKVQMVPHTVGQLSELSFSLVLDTEIKCCTWGRKVELLHLSNI